MTAEAVDAAPAGAKSPSDAAAAAPTEDVFCGASATQTQGGGSSHGTESAQEGQDAH